MIEDVLKVAILSLIEGVTEFVPISSTGHLIVGTALLNFDAIGSVFEIFIQIGAVAAVIVYYRKTLGRQASFLGASAEIRRFWLTIVLGSAPAVVLGYWFAEPIESLLFTPRVVAFSLIVGGIAFILVERLPRFHQNGDVEGVKLTDVTLRQALIIGLVQALALIPGMSRSGSSIIGGILAGLNRRIATEFSFFLAIPLLGGATLYKFITSMDSLAADQLALLLLGAVLSAYFAWRAIGWLLKFISRHSFVAFGVYRIVAGLLILLAVSSGLIS